MWCTTHFDILNSLGADHQRDRQTADLNQNADPPKVRTPLFAAVGRSRNLGRSRRGREAARSGRRQVSRADDVIDLFRTNRALSAIFLRADRC